MSCYRDEDQKPYVLGVIKQSEIEISANEELANNQEYLDSEGYPGFT